MATSKETVEEHTLWHYLLNICNEIKHNQGKILSKANLTKAQYSILLEIAFLNYCKDNPIMISDLMIFHNVSTASISLITQRMENKQLVKRVRGLSNKRVVYIELTPKGERLLKETVKPTTEFILELFSVFSKEEVTLAVSLMKKLMGKLHSNIWNESEFEEKYSLEQMIDFLNKLYESP